MRKRQRKKNIKVRAIYVEQEIGINHLRCGECDRYLKPWSNKYHLQYGTCNSYCYGKLVGVYA